MEPKEHRDVVSDSVSKLLKEGQLLKFSRHSEVGEAQAIEVPAKVLQEFFDPGNLSILDPGSEKLFSVASFKISGEMEEVWMEGYKGGVFRIEDAYFRVKSVPKWDPLKSLLESGQK